MIEELTDFADDALAVSTPGYGRRHRRSPVQDGARQPASASTLNDSIAVDDLFTPAVRFASSSSWRTMPSFRRLQFGRDRRHRHHHLRVRVQGRRRDARPGRSCRKLGESGIESRVPVPFQARGQGAPSRPSTSTRRRRPCTSALPSGQAACGDPGVPGHQLRVRFRRCLRACRRRG